MSGVCSCSPATLRVITEPRPSQLAAGPVEDHAAHRDEGDVHAVLAGAPLPDPPDPEDLDVERAQDDEQVDRGQPADDDPRAAVHFTRIILSVWGSTIPSWAFAIASIRAGLRRVRISVFSSSRSRSSAFFSSKAAVTA